MEQELSFFERYLREAPGDDEPPDAVQASDDAPPDIPEGAGSDPGPPDMGGDDPPPDMGDGGMDDPPDMGDEAFGTDDEDGSGDQGDGGEEQIDGLDEKVSAIMNQRLYQRFLPMLNTINNQLSQVRSNNDILYALAPDSLDITEALTKLDENIRTYLKEKFLNANYSANLLFFNKCLNLLDILNKIFSKKVHKGIKAAE